jgi:hypothetical protein
VRELEGLGTFFDKRADGTFGPVEDIKIDVLVTPEQWLLPLDAGLRPQGDRHPGHAAVGRCRTRRLSLHHQSRFERFAACSKRTSTVQTVDVSGRLVGQFLGVAPNVGDLRSGQRHQ